MIRSRGIPLGQCRCAAAVFQASSIADRMMALAWWDWAHDALHRALGGLRSASAEEILNGTN